VSLARTGESLGTELQPTSKIVNAKNWNMIFKWMLEQPNDPKLSHGHWKPGFACNLDFQISSAHPKTQWAVAVGSSAVLGRKS
jgi:hypothetical protein